MTEGKGSSKVNTPALYSAADFYMLRAPALPAAIFSQITAMPLNPAQAGQEKLEVAMEDARAVCKRQLLALAAEPAIEQALAVGSFAILEGLAHVRRGDNSRRVERAFSRLLRYIVRMSTRPTPFGLFAGVTMGTFADESPVQLATPVIGYIRTRPDMNWLLSVIHQIEQSRELVSQLKITTNQTLCMAGGRIFLPYADTYGQNDRRSISLRATPVVQYVLRRASQPIIYADLRSELLAAYPRATEEQVDTLLWQLWEHRFLLSTLRPPLTGASPASYVLEQLDNVHGADTAKNSLRSVLNGSEAIDRAGMGGPIMLIRELADRLQQFAPDEQEQTATGGVQASIQVDAALHLDAPYLHRSIGAAAAQAAETLLRLSTFSTGPTYLQEYRAAFIERYSLNAEVPLLDLLSPETGLDAPPGYNQPPRTYPLTPQSSPPDNRSRDALLCRLVATAINDGPMEIELTEPLLRKLERWSPKTGEVPPSLEIYLQVQSASREALDRGEWRAVIGPNCGSTAGGRTFGRFFDLLGPAGLEALQQFIQQEEALYPDTIFAELSYLPPQARMANVAVRPALRTYEIVVGTTPSVPADRVIQLSDLVVGVRNNRFYLRSLRLGKEVVVCQNHMLNTYAAPNACRFLLEVGHDGFPLLMPFDWGAAASSPFLPRVVQKRVVLRPAEWNVAKTDIAPAGSGSDTARWFSGLQQWRTQWHVPRYVYLTQADNRLLLDLEHPALAAELRTELEKLGENDHLTLQEALPGLDSLWLKDREGAAYFCEIVVPLLRANVPSTDENRDIPIRRVQPSRAITRAERYAFPGEEWVYLKLYAAQQRHDELIAKPMRELIYALEDQGMIDRWFYIRYSDPELHLRLRLHARESQYNRPLLEAALDWSRQLAHHEIIRQFGLATYEPEIERYGGPYAITMMEEVFAADSMVISRLIEAQYAHEITVDSQAIAVLSLDQLFGSWGLDFTRRLAWLQTYMGKHDATNEFRKRRRLFCDLLAPWEQTRDDALLAQRGRILELLAPQQSVLRTTAERVHELEVAGKLWASEELLLSSLAHMRINRLLGIDQQQEQQLYTFWRHTLESISRRPGAQNALSSTEKGRGNEYHS